MKKKIINNLVINGINSLDTNAAVSIGENLLNGWSAHGKRNDGTGRSAGITENKSNTNIVIDNDLVDCPIYDKGSY